MAPDEPASPERLDAQFSQIVQQNYGVGAPQWPAPVPYPQKKRPSAGRVVAVVGSVMAVLCMVGLAMAATALNVLAPERTEPRGESQRVADRVGAALQRQRAALLSGDEAAYLAVLDPSIDGSDKEALGRQFRSLRAMKAVQWRDQVTTATALGTDDLWEVDVVSSACFVVEPCPPEQVASKTRWRVVGEQATLADWDAGRHPHPWQASELIARIGERVVAATTRQHEGRLAEVLREAERAAKVADRFAQDKPPPRYVVYYAGKAEWRTWFSSRPPDWSAGVAVDVSDDRYEVVLNGEEMVADMMPTYLRHELTHASSMPGKVTSGEKHWWLMEGIAELAAFDGEPARDHPGLDGVAAALSVSGKGFQLEPPGADATREVVDGSYAVAFLAARCLVERFGEKGFVQFFHAVLHENRGEDRSASELFGMQWADLSEACMDYISSTSR